MNEITYVQWSYWKLLQLRQNDWNENGLFNKLLDPQTKLFLSISKQIVYSEDFYF